MYDDLLCSFSYQDLHSVRKRISHISDNFEHAHITVCETASIQEQTQI